MMKRNVILGLLTLPMLFACGQRGLRTPTVVPNAVKQPLEAACVNPLPALKLGTPMPATEFITKLNASATNFKLVELQAVIEKSNDAIAYMKWTSLDTTATGGVSCRRMSDNQSISLNISFPDELAADLSASKAQVLTLNMSKVPEDQAPVGVPSLRVESKAAQPLQLNDAEYLYFQGVEERTYLSTSRLTAEQFDLGSGKFALRFEISRNDDAGLHVQNESYYLVYQMQAPAPAATPTP